MTESETLKAYDKLADDYVKLVESWDPPGLSEFIGALQPGARVLDLGCGPGQDAARIAAAGFEVLAVDGSVEMVARAAERAGVSARQATFDEIPGFGTFDGIWASFSLLHAPRARFAGYIADLHAASGPLARLGLGMKLGEGDEIDKFGRHYVYHSEEELRGVLEEAGFTWLDAIHGVDKGLAGEPEEWIVIAAHA